jgi:isocitrate dehydrogenase kinase/phosphatase
VDQNARVEMIKSVFYRNKCAYLIGRAVIRTDVHPFVIPLLHEKQGLYVDSLLTDPNELGVIFSYYRSYFLVDIDIPGEYVDFLASIMPFKELSELYNSIGFEKHGKTELYRGFLKHLTNSDDQFEVAPGIKGMVMSVFTLPSYSMVFKVIKDRFDPPKKMTRLQVKAKYQLVSEHDRVGRLADTHEFENFVFPLDRFSSSLLEELKEVAPSLLLIKEKTLEIKHLYAEKKMIPLNLYLSKASHEDAIKQLAAANIFPGDMLLKNFGVTRMKRVVFYDYDEIVMLTDCNFRIIPEARDDFEELSSDPWYSVGENDIFPEEFKRFLIGDPRVKALFFKLH